MAQSQIPGPLLGELNEPRPAVDNTNDADRDSATSGGLAPPPHLHDTESATMSHHGPGAQRPHDLYDKKAMHESASPVHAVFSTPELLIMVLSNLSTRDLTRSLTVSKHWQDVILDTKSKELRRILILETAAPREYLRLWGNTDRRCFKDEDGNRIWEPAIVHEPDEHSIPIVEMHPILLSGCGLGAETYAITSVRCDDLRAVPPSTYLFRQPVEEIQFGDFMCGNNVRNPGGVTFGTLQEEMAKHPSYESRRSIFVEEVIPSVTKMIESARIAEAVKQLYADKETMSPEVFEYNMAHVWEGRPAVHDAEFERLRMLGRVGLHVAPATT